MILEKELENIIELAEKKPATGFNCFQIAKIARKVLEELRQKPERRKNNV